MARLNVDGLMAATGLFACKATSFVASGIAPVFLDLALLDLYVQLCGARLNHSDSHLGILLPMQMGGVFGCGFHGPGCAMGCLGVMWASLLAQSNEADMRARLACLINPGLNIVLLHDVRGAGHFFGATIDVQLGDNDVFLTNFVEIVENLAGCAVTTSHYPPNFYPQVDGCDCLLYVMLFAELIAYETAAGAPYPLSREAPMFGADLDGAGTWPLLKYEWYFRSDASQVARRRAFAHVLTLLAVGLHGRRMQRRRGDDVPVPPNAVSLLNRKMD
ncbi:hypothetical protein H9P43_007096 [Blastocladiella emersonii ATCC 22665]|nr:hypothetical protein H9P43_007096 [Blastocladiella emersonii ATCC 22665]